MIRIFGLINKNVPSCCKISTSGVDDGHKYLFENKDLLVILQGNIFGVEEDKPAEYISRKYVETKNMSFLKKINGSFNFIILDKLKKTIFIGTDKYGSIPLFIYQKNDTFFFASKIKFLLDMIGEEPTPNWKAWGEYLTFRFTLGEDTFYNGIKLVSNGTFFKIDYRKNIKVARKRYWDFSQIELDYKSSYEEKVLEGVEVFKKVFERLNKKIRRSKTLIALSGGYDSRSIVSGLLKYSPSRTFDTITTLHPAGPEKDIVDKLCDKLHLSNIYIDRPINIYEKYYIQKEYLTDYLVQEHLWIMPMINTIRKYDAYIDGIAGDIVMRSTRVRPIHITKKDDSLFLSKLFKKQFGFEYNWLKKYLDSNIWQKIKYTNKWVVNELNGIPTTENRMTIFLMKNRVRNGISIASSNIIGDNVQTVLQPFFNDELMTFGLSIPHKYKFRFIYREIIDRSFPEIKDIKSTSDENLEKLKEYDKKILKFNQNPRELISDYSEISSQDKTYLLKLLNSLDFPPFINKLKFMNDINIDLKINRVNTILDMVLWFNNYK